VMQRSPEVRQQQNSRPQRQGNSGQFERGSNNNRGGRRV
jgi:hypothetical protein